jgi:hypothetical protein
MTLYTASQQLLMAILPKPLIFICRWFSKSKNLKEFSNKGYRLGIIVLLLLLLLSRIIALDLPIKLLPEILQINVFNWVEKYVTGIDGNTSIILLLIVTYGILGLFEKSRSLLGNKVASTFFWIFRKLLDLGDWFIQHRSFSVYALAVMASCLLGLSSYIVYLDKYSARLVSDHREWLKATDEFIGQNTFSKIENEKYKKIEPKWDKLKTLIPSNVEESTPTILLHDLLHTLNSEEAYKKVAKSTSWNTFLFEKLSEIDDINTKLEVFKVRDISTDEQMSLILTYITLGKVYVRIAQNSIDDNKKVSSTEDDYLKKAKDSFEKALGLCVSRGFEERDESKRIRFFSKNGLGQVLSNAFSYNMEFGVAHYSDKFCNNKHCLDAAQQYYQDAGSEFPQNCSSAQKRELNNITDLYIKIGIYYKHLYDKKPNIMTIDCDKREAGGFADCIEKRTESMMACAFSEPIVGNVFITAAQAYSVSASLKYKSIKETNVSNQLRKEADVSNQLRKAALYSQIAYAFDPDNLKDWTKRPFCFLLTNPDQQPDKTINDNSDSVIKSLFEKEINESNLYPAKDYKNLGVPKLNTEVFFELIRDKGKCKQ